MTKRLLLVEDDEMLRRAMPRLLTRFGYDVHVAASCEEATTETGYFDVGVFDINLPDGDGVDLARHLFSSKLLGSVVFYTGSLELDRVDDAALLGTIVTKIDGIAGLRAALLETEARGRPSSDASG